MFMMNASLAIAFGFLVVPGSRYYGVSTATFLIWMSVFSLSMAAGFTLAGSLIRRYGVKRQAFVFGLVASTSLACMAFAPTVTVLYLFACPFGFAYSGCTVLPANSLVNGWHRHRRRGTVLGIVGTGSGVAAIVWGFAMPFLVEHSGLRGSLLTLALVVLCLVAVPAALLVTDPPLNASTRISGSADAAGPEPGRRSFSWAVAALVLATFAFSAESVFAQIQAAIYEAWEMSDSLAGWLVSYFAGSVLVAKPTVGYLYDRLGAVALVGVLAVMFTFGLPAIVLLHEKGLWSFLVFLPIAAISVCVQTVILPLFVSHIIGKQRFASVYGYTLTAAHVGVAIAGPLWGRTRDVYGVYDLAMFVAGGLGLVGLLLAFIALKLGNTSKRVRQSATT
ncbi:hypothetical protein A5761_10065 [Mycolicibacterium setense]|uniref:MFS transporter n=1 Tax=Mycolicibacterium setense TaxID=431269 RepID=UPI0007EB5E54|nr:MFS transporter [Mycolicibacterium setense]OBB17688.1 hypothetical protein A5761_10065 [Mycolicibacterium setense]